ncbi:hypothetical protein PQ459_13450 [Chryseobacterium sp. KACC 21268]|nr:hypothetical protein PQ459_13450 [Chryseobacterium sp. KACC 21268]
MRKVNIYTQFILLALVISCKKKYERPDHFSVDLFENERNEQPKKTLTPQEASGKSLLVLKTIDIELLNKFKIEDKNIKIFKINSGTIIKSANDSIRFPIKIISNYDLKISDSNVDSIAVYLIKPQSYKLLVRDIKIDYQTLPAQISQ